MKRNLQKKKICNKLEDQLKSLINETEFLQKKSGEPLQKINELLETQAALQQQNHDYKENIEKLIKENQKQYKNIILLEKEKSELIQENENINNSLLEMDSRLKSKIPKTTDFKKRIKNMGQTSVNMIRYSVDNSNNRINNNLKSGNSKNKTEMPKKPSNLYSNTNTNTNSIINTNETKSKKASQTMTDFRKKKQFNY